MNRKKLIDTFPFILICLIYLISITHPINLITADLGRHLKNGQIFVQNLKIPLINYYSYTQPSFPFINHHWGSGVIFYLIYKIFSFTGLSIFFSLISLAVFCLFYKIAVIHGSKNLAILLALFLIPLLLERTEIRPEVFSYLLSGIFYYLLIKFKKNQLSFHWLLILPILQLLWVNLHIYFFLGLMLIGLFWLEYLLKRRQQSQQFNNVTIVLILSLLAVFINPFGLKGVLTPLNIFNNYGYRVLENQPVWFIEKLIPNPNYLIFKIVFVILIASLLRTGLQRRPVLGMRPTINLFLGLVLSLMAWLSIRNFTLFALFALPIISQNLSNVTSRLQPPSAAFARRIINITIQGLIIFVFLLVISGNLKLSPRPQPFGIGLDENNTQSIDFFKKQGLIGPVFNNYDIGGYLIWHLFPKEKVFVDNRPEAYSVDFFQKIYVPMQENEKTWQKIDQKYGFNVIFFFRRDATPWGQQFLVSRIKDPAWAPTFVDNNTIIFLKRNKKNEAIIKTYEIPREYFKVNNS